MTGPEVPVPTISAAMAPAASLLHAHITGDQVRFEVLARLHRTNFLLAGMTTLAKVLGGQLYGERFPGALQQMRDECEPAVAPPVVERPEAVAEDPLAALDMLAAYITGNQQGIHAALSGSSAHAIAYGFLRVAHALLLTPACADDAEAVGKLRFMGQMMATYEVLEGFGSSTEHGDE